MNAFQKLVARGWWAIALLFLAGAGVAAWFLPGFSVEAGTDVLLNEDDPDLAYYNQTRADWVYDEYIIVCAHRKDGWFNKEGLQQLNGLSKDLKAVKHVKEQTSILTVPLLANVKQGLTIVDAKTDELDERIDYAKAKQELLGHTHAVGNLIAPGGEEASILVYLKVPEGVNEFEPLRMKLIIERNSLKTDAARRAELERQILDIDPKYNAAKNELGARRIEFVNGVRDVSKKWGATLGTPLRLSGLSHINVNLLEQIRADLKVFGIASFALFTLMYFAVYRKLRWTLLPILACVLPVIVILGSMVAAGKSVTVITSNLPVLLFVLMLPYSVYFVERYCERRSLFPDEDPKVSTTMSPLEIWTPCLYSCTTTMAGTASLLTSGINPVRVFGLMMTIGMGLGLATIMLFLPATVIPLRGLKYSGLGAQSEPIRAVRPLVAMVLRVPLLVVLVSLAILGVSVWGATKITVENKFIDYFWPSSEIYQGLDFIDKKMGGTTPLEIILETDQRRRFECLKCAKLLTADMMDAGKCRTCGERAKKHPGFFETPQGLAALESVGAFFDGVPETGNMRSFKTLVDEVKKSVKLPEASVIGVVSTLAKATVRDFCTPDYATSRIQVRMKETAPTLNRNRILGALRAHLRSLESGPLKGVRVRETGIFVLYANMLNSLIQSQKDTFVMVVAAIWVMLVVLFVYFPEMSKNASTALATGLFVLVAIGLGAWMWPTFGWKTFVVITETKWVLIWLGLSLVALIVAAAGIAFAKSMTPARALGRWLIETPALPTIILIPQVLPVFVVLGAMGFAGIPLDMVTVMIASMAMGVGIDAAIQYTVRYKIELAMTGGDVREAVKRSHSTIGRSIMIATSIVFAGFIILALSQFRPTMYFGLFTGLAMLMGLFASLTTLPAMFVLLKYPRR